MSLRENDGAVFCRGRNKILRWDGKKTFISGADARASRRLPAMRCDGVIYVHDQLTGAVCPRSRGGRSW